jgi:predicted DCC family thiol-disulfide oxidoreductase YuxK
MFDLTSYQKYSFLNDPTVPEFEHNFHLLVMDGNCTLCSRGARIISAMDRKAQFRIAPVHTPLGTALLTHYGFDPNDPDSWLYIANGQAYSSLDAIIRVAQTCSLWGNILMPLRCLPTSWQNWLYQRMAKNRYRLFGRTDMCAIPSKSLQDRLLK